MQINEFFNLTEFEKSPTAIRKGIQNKIPQDCIAPLLALVTNVLTPIRQHYNLPVVINSGYRCPKLNSLVGGAKQSQHVYSNFDCAVDFEVPGIANGALYSFIKNTLDYDQVILEHHDINEPSSGWIHCSWNINGNRKQAFSIGGKDAND